MKQIIESLYSCAGVINLSNKDEFEVQPKVFSSIYVNFKSTLSNPKTRKKLVRIIVQNVENQTNYVCGIESGASYYASAVADILNKKLIFLRKVKKEYNIKNRFAGTLPKVGDRVLIIDDVMSSGNTLAKAVNVFKKIGCKVEAIIIFSYCWQEIIARSLGIKIISLSNADELVEYGLSHKKISVPNAKLIKEYIDREEFRVYGSKKK